MVSLDVVYYKDVAIVDEMWMWGVLGVHKGSLFFLVSLNHFIFDA